MRPQCLNTIFRPLSALKGVGPAKGEALARLLHAEQKPGGCGPLVRDLLWHLPSGVTDRRHLWSVAEAPLDSTVSLIIIIDEHFAPTRRYGKSPYRIACHDETGDLMLVFFSAKPDYLKAQLPVGQKRLISGRLELFDGVRQMTHPELIVRPEQRASALRLEPNYPLTHQLSARQLRALIQEACRELPDLPEWLLVDMQTDRGWHGWRESVLRIHQPKEPEDIGEASPWRQRLAYDELLASQLALALVRVKSLRQQGIAISGNSPLRERLLAALPFTLTQGQQRVLAEIDADLASGNRMLRLLQGDVGSGKTIVALLAMLPLIEQGYQCALMVPTDILGQQHLQSMQPLLEPLGITALMLSGKQGAAQRSERLRAIADGTAQVIIGTHALFQEKVSFHQLGMVIIDEQHRFGVRQRLALTSKGTTPHTLLMTATPIPRSLTMTAYGDMDSSVLPEKPANRQPIETRAMPLSRIDEIVTSLGKAIENGSKAYWICPLVEESEEASRPEGDLAAATECYHVFRRLFGERVALMHGKMSSEAREEAMQGFAGDRYDLLVATTVVEVGVNVPEATIMVIEHAERFGLAQLHQLRGRVGRGAARSSCVLLYQSPLSQVGQQRLRIIRETNDGFRIAEEDVLLRGAGDVLGTRQSGFPDYRIARLPEDRELLYAARDDVKYLLHQDPTLETPRGQALRVLLYLFGHDESLRYLQAG